MSSAMFTIAGIDATDLDGPIEMCVMHVVSEEVLWARTDLYPPVQSHWEREAAIGDRLVTLLDGEDLRGVYFHDDGEGGTILAYAGGGGTIPGMTEHVGDSLLGPDRPRGLAWALAEYGVQRERARRRSEAMSLAPADPVGVVDKSVQTQDACDIMTRLQRVETELAVTQELVERLTTHRNIQLGQTSSTTEEENDD